MSTHNMFLWRNKENINTFQLEKKHPIKSLDDSTQLSVALIVWKLKLKKINCVKSFSSINWAMSCEA